jgi:hypothetical protein
VSCRSGRGCHGPALDDKRVPGDRDVGDRTVELAAWLPPRGSLPPCLLGERVPGEPASSAWPPGEAAAPRTSSLSVAQQGFPLRSRHVRMKHT